MAILGSLRSLLSLLNSSALLIIGTLLGCWAWVGTYEPVLAFDMALWAAENSPLPLTVTPRALANDVVQGGSLKAAAFSGACLIAIWIVSLLNARVAQRPGERGIGGEAEIELQTEHPRAGGTLQGSLRLHAPPKPEQAYRVELSCRREYRAFADDRRERVEIPFAEQRDIAAVQTASGWSVPFRFHIPLGAPATTPVPFGGYTWRLTYCRADAVIAFPAGITLSVGAAPAEELRASESAQTPEQEAAVAAVAEAVGRKDLLPHERAQARTLSIADDAMVRRVVRNSGKVGKWLVIAVVGLPIVGAALVFVATLLSGK